MIRFALGMAVALALVACGDPKREACERAGGTWDTVIVPAIEPRVGQQNGPVIPPKVITTCRKP